MKKVIKIKSNLGGIGLALNSALLDFLPGLHQQSLLREKCKNEIEDKTLVRIISDTNSQIRKIPTHHPRVTNLDRQSGDECIDWR
jgi:hypothetical protein